MFFDSFFGGGGGGFHSGFPGQGGSDDEEVDTEGLYKILGVNKNATDREIKKAFKKAALKHHPDRGGDAEKFKEVEKAKQILTDPKKRKLYDKYGEKGVERGGAAGGGDIFDLFTGGRSRQDQGPPKPKTITQTVDITLEDVYKGSAIKRKWKIKHATRRYDCRKCDGSGQVRHLVRQGPMMLQTQRQCDTCRGRGFDLPDEKEIERSGTVHIPHGIKNGGKIILHGEGHSLPDYQKGDVAFVVRLKKHKIYHRKGADLGCQQTLTLCEALCGYEFRLKHVSGKTLIVKSQPGEVVQPGDLKVLSDYGLPQKGNHFVRGHLYIQFKIVFPMATSLSNNQKGVLKSALDDVEYPEIVETTELGQGSRVKVHLNATAAHKIYGRRGEMTAYGIIADEMRDDGEAWPVELDPIDGHGESRLVVVPAAWVEADDEGSRSHSVKKKKRSKKNKRRRSSNVPMDADADEEGYETKDDEYEDEEEVFLETVVGEAPKPTPAQGGSIHDDDADEHQGGRGGVQCQQM